MLQCFSKKKSNGRNRFFECFSLTAQSALYGQTKRLYSSKQQLGEQGQCPEFLHHWLDSLKRFLQLLGSGFSFALMPWSHSSGDASFSPFLCLWSSLCSSSASNLGRNLPAIAVDALRTACSKRLAPKGNENSFLTIPKPCWQINELDAEETHYEGLEVKFTLYFPVLFLFLFFQNTPWKVYQSHRMDAQCINNVKENS
jgi:hypothetical protein